MPVRIIRTPAPATPGPDKPRITIRHLPKPSPSPEGASVAAKAHTRGWEVGGGVILRTHDLTPEANRVKFLLHLVKEKVWYLVEEFDAEINRIELQSQVRFKFACRVDQTLYRNYVVAVYPEGTTEPTAEMLTFVNRKAATLVQAYSQEPTAA